MSLISKYVLSNNLAVVQNAYERDELLKLYVVCLKLRLEVSNTDQDYYI